VSGRDESITEMLAARLLVHLVRGAMSRSPPGAATQPLFERILQLHAKGRLVRGALRGADLSGLEPALVDAMKPFL
jgi:hypothetical protein